MAGEAWTPYTPQNEFLNPPQSSINPGDIRVSLSASDGSLLYISVSATLLNFHKVSFFPNRVTSCAWVSNLKRMPQKKRDRRFDLKFIQETGSADDAVFNAM